MNWGSGKILKWLKLTIIARKHGHGFGYDMGIQEIFNKL